MLPDIWPGYQGMSEPYRPTSERVRLDLSPSIIVLLSVALRLYCHDADLQVISKSTEVIDHPLGNHVRRHHIELYISESSYKTASGKRALTDVGKVLPLAPEGITDQQGWETSADPRSCQWVHFECTSYQSTLAKWSCTESYITHIPLENESIH